MPISIVVFDGQVPSTEFMRLSLRGIKGEAHPFAPTAMLLRAEFPTHPNTFKERIETRAKQERKIFKFTVISLPRGEWETTHEDKVLKEWLDQAQRDDDSPKAYGINMT